MALFRLAPKKMNLSPLLQQVAKSSSHGGKGKIGNRDIVGFGINGEYTYVDHIAFPMPAVRWRENTPEVVVSRRFFNQF